MRRITAKKLEDFFEFFSKNPFEKKLKTHKVQSKNFGLKFSSRIDGDLRVIWDFSDEQHIRIFMLDIGGHAGSKKVYV